jgi:hypothetical protein
MGNKICYERATLVVVTLAQKDIIATSGVFGDSDNSIVLPEDIF